MTTAPRLLPLEAVRGLAALSVISVHIALETGNYHLLPVGFVALDIFFVMSGFVNSLAYDDKLLAGLSWSRFMLLRIVRVYPSMFLGLLVGLLAYAVIPASAYPIGLIEGGHYQLSWKTIGHFFLVPDLTAREGIFPLNGVFWSLFFELVIIGVHGLTVRHLTVRRLSIFVVVIAVAWGFIAITGGKWGWGAGWNGPSFVRGFLRVGWAYGAGVLLRRATAYGWKVPALVPLALTVFVLFLPDYGMLRLRMIFSVFVLAPLIVALAAGAVIPAAWRGIAKWAGAISYPVYATHHPLLLILVYYFQPSGFAEIAAAIVAVILVATVIEYLYDAPIRKWLLGFTTPPDVTRAPELPHKMP